MRKVMVCTPSHDGRVVVDYSQSLYLETLAALERSIAIKPQFYCGISDISLARNHMVAVFLASDFDDMVFIDSDQGWQMGAVCKLLAHDADIVGGAVPVKRDPEDYRLRWLPGDIKTDDKGLIEVEGIGTGFMRITRKALEAVAKVSEEYHWPDSPTGKCHGIFLPEIIGGHYFTEDLRFCQKARELGFTVFLDPYIRFTHTGTKIYEGEISGWLQQHMAQHRQLEEIENMRAA